MEGITDQEIDALMEEELAADDDDAFVIRTSRKKRGRREKLTPQIQFDIVNALAAGNFITVAVEFAGIDRATFYLWCKKGREHPRSKYGKFLAEVRHAVRQAEVAFVSQMTKAALNGNTDALKFMLTHKYYVRWGDKAKVEIGAGKDTKIVLEYTNAWNKPTVVESDNGEGSSPAGTPDTGADGQPQIQDNSGR